MDRFRKSAKFILDGMATHKRVVLAQIIPMRRCDLACTYCNERDDDSKPVPIEEVKEWIDKLAEFRTINITISGGEPTLHPGIYEIVSYIRSKGIMAGLITHGRTLTTKNIEKLNAAGLQDLQISIDNVHPDVVSKKSLSYYEEKGTLQNLAELAQFDVNLNSVIGSDIPHPEDALTITKRAKELGFGSTVGIIHDGDGQIRPFSGDVKKIYDEIIQITAKSRLQFAHYSAKFQRDLLEHGESLWKCRAGARYLYICEHGRIQWCSQHRVCKDGAKHGDPVANSGVLDIPLKDFTWEEFERQYSTEKWCAPKCTIQCVRLVGIFDRVGRSQVPFSEYQ